jgi:hypothetical protein
VHKKILLISILFFCSAFSRSTTFDDRTSCEDSKGAWRQFGNSCADECEAKLDEFAFCTDLVISACECGKSRCWNDEVKSCAALSDYKKIFVARQKEEKKIADAARKKREEAAAKEETIISNITNIVKTPGAKTAANETPKTTENPPINPPGPVVSQSPPTIPPLFLQQEKAKQDAKKEAEKNNPGQTPTISIPGLPVIPLPQ